MLVHTLPAAGASLDQPACAGQRTTPQTRTLRQRGLPLAMVVTGHLIVALLLMTPPGRQLIRETPAMFVTLLPEAAATRTSEQPTDAARPVPVPALPSAHMLPAVTLQVIELSAGGTTATQATSTPAPGDGGKLPAPATTPSDAPTAPRFDADYLNNPAPAYPPLARRMGEEGRVVLRVQVDPEGTPVALEVRATSGHPRLDQAAMEAVRRWKFVPAVLGGLRVAAWVLVPVSFSLRNQPTGTR